MVRGRTGTLGRQAEQYARRYLIANGLRPVAQNFRCRMGEIDLVMADGNCLVFVEVRYRSARRLTSAKNTVDHFKRGKLVRTAAMFLASDARYANCTVRFDVVGIDQSDDQPRSVDWVQDAFRPADASL